MTQDGAYWLNALGISRADSTDAFDFKLVADFAAPSWLEDTVFYQIFPDRFHNGDPANDVPPGAWTHGKYATQRRDWGAPPLPYREAGNLDYYGGDLAGIAQKLDYLVDLGVNALYLTPIFVAYSNHRYDIADYDHVDPYLGGDEALAELRRALDRAGMRLILDVTPNHLGSQHPWFTDAVADPDAPTAEYFTFHEHPHSYESWLGVNTLVKLDYRSERLRDAMYRAESSVLRRWMREPYHMDGWRLDVANMMARQGAVQLAHKVGRQMRRAVKADNPQAYLFGEHFYDGTPHLQGDELDATMNYSGFTMPLWMWLAGRDHNIPPRPWTDTTLLPGEALAEQWSRFRAAAPWAIARQQFNLLDSHDTPRILTLVNGDRALVKLAVTILMTYPGVPSVYYADEIGMEGENDPDCRRCMRWDETTWDTDLRAHFQQVIGLRRTAPALRRGGFQQVYADGGLIVYLRQSPEQRLLVVGYRGPEALASVEVPVWHAGLADGTALTDLLGSGTYTVEHGMLRLEGLERGAAMVLEG
jgi:alpha-glucosidase